MALLPFGDCHGAILLSVAATSDSRASSLGPPVSWAEKCGTILQKVLDSLGLEQQWFDRPVDEYYIPGYYSKIKNPMDLGTMKNKLDTGKYKHPSAFCEVGRIALSDGQTTSTACSSSA